MKGDESVSLRPTSSTRNGWAIPFADQNGYVGGGIRLEGISAFEKLHLSPESACSVADEAIGYTRSSSTRVSCIGDSLSAGYYPNTTVNWTESAYPYILSKLAPAGVEVFNLAISGYTVDEAAVRIGAFPLPLVVMGGSLPATGPISVSTTAAIGWRPTGTERNMKGTLAGVPGTLIRTTSNTTFTFTRTAPGIATPVPPGTLFKPESAGHEADTVVIMLGRNNIPGIAGGDNRAEDNVVNGIKRIVDWLSPQLKQALILSTTTNTLEKRGTSGYLSILEINARLQQMYPNKFLDIRSYLVHQAIYDLGVTPTSDDLANMECDALPPSIMLDTTHYKPETAALVARQVHAYLTMRGWI
ncbi:SGNH/GDSL hydrolase family protein [Arthrobacter zhaoxinii]|uniref:SGNH/GDSL hydrolase family protein n=1 Tax=Arthrobacter zhaoxinii TaxID=2964616 RepID=UPI002106BD91|nr:SGNH/GDSL hydrolase family protein [Arthrobacter zhaoxinii]MCQ1999102.1 SGNH/GDSL hydrolase family protein [Arthrobacter zhaoxinii]